MNTRALYKIKHDHVMVDGGIMLIGVIMYYIMLYMSIYFLSRFTDEVARALVDFPKVGQQQVRGLSD
jgi:hypothetical protein